MSAISAATSASAKMDGRIMRRGILAHANQVTFPTLYSLAGRLSLQ